MNNDGYHAANQGSRWGATCVSPWSTILKMLLIYTRSPKSMLRAPNLNLSDPLTLLRQGDLIWAAEHSERPNPHSPLLVGFMATVGGGGGCFGLAFKKQRCYPLSSAFLSWVLVAWYTPDIMNGACCNHIVLLYTFSVV